MSWEHWIERYEARGFRVLAPEWPGMDGDIDELRRDPSGIGHLSIREIIDHYAAIIRELDRLIGPALATRLFPPLLAGTRDYFVLLNPMPTTSLCPVWEVDNDKAMRSVYVDLLRYGGRKPDPPQ